MGNGELNATGAAASGRALSTGTLTDSQGRNTITLTPAGVGARAIYATEIFRGTNLGASAPGTNTSNIFFTNAPSLNQSGAGTIAAANSFAAIGSGNLNTDEAAVLRGALVDTSASGNGASFATYDPAVGVRALNASEQSSTIVANKNVK